MNDTTSSSESFRAIVSGRVQGVGFRYFVQRRASALGISGCVFNRSDGGVEVQAMANRDQLDQLIVELRKGPSMSRVDGVEIEWSYPMNASGEFRITHG